MVSHDDVAIAWRNGSKATGSRMYTDGTTIFSYGEHFPIATYRQGVILFNDDKYSSSTSKHQSIVSSHCNGAVYNCTTKEIKHALDYPNEPIVLTKMEEPDYLPHIMDILKNFCKKRGVKRFPMKNLTEQIEKMIVMENL